MTIPIIPGPLSGIARGATEISQAIAQRRARERAENIENLSIISSLVQAGVVGKQEGFGSPGAAEITDALGLGIPTVPEELNLNQIGDASVPQRRVIQPNVTSGDVREGLAKTELQGVKPGSQRAQTILPDVATDLDIQGQQTDVIGKGLQNELAGKQIDTLTAGLTTQTAANFAQQAFLQTKGVVSEQTSQVAFDNFRRARESQGQTINEAVDRPIIDAQISLLLSQQMLNEINVGKINAQSGASARTVEQLNTLISEVGERLANMQRNPPDLVTNTFATQAQALMQQAVADGKAPEQAFAELPPQMASALQTVTEYSNTLDQLQNQIDGMTAASQNLISAASGTEAGVPRNPPTEGGGNITPRDIPGGGGQVPVRPEQTNVPTFEVQDIQGLAVSLTNQDDLDIDGDIRAIQQFVLDPQTAGQSMSVSDAVSVLQAMKILKEDFATQIDRTIAAIQASGAN